MTNIIHRDPHIQLPVAARGEGSFIYDESGKRYYDASGGAAVSCLGHGHPKVLEAMWAQMQALEYAHTGSFTTRAAESLAEMLSSRSPENLSHAYIVSSGSEAVETAIKMARQYQVNVGESQRWRIVSRRLSYHGNTLGALAVGGHAGRRALYEPMLMPAHQVSPCFAYHYQHPGEDDAQYAQRLADELEETLLELGPHTVAAFLAETVVGATTGAVAAVPGYFERIRAVCDRYGVLLILDEVISGMGRTGHYHAFEPEGVVPDILCLAKGLGGGYQPIGAVLAHTRVVDVLHAGKGAFRHGQTYVGHPIACAAALAVQQVLTEPGVLDNVGKLGSHLESRLRARLGDHPHVGDIRGRGLFWAIELVSDRETRRPFAAELALHAKVKQQAQMRGLLCYPGGGTQDGVNGDHVLLAPPYLTTEQEIDEAVDVLADTLNVVLDKVTATH